MQLPLCESPPHIPLAALRPIALHKGPVDTSVPPTTSYLAEPASPPRNSGVLLTRTETPEGVGSALPRDVPGGCQNIARENRRTRRQQSHRRENRRRPHHENLRRLHPHGHRRGRH